MAYSTPATQTTGDVIGATAWNLLVNDVKWDNEIDSTGAPSCWASRSTTVNISNNTLTAVTWNSHAWDNAGVHSTSVNPTRFTAPVDGIYWLQSWVHWDMNATGIRVNEFLINGSGNINASDGRPALTGWSVGHGATGIVSLTAGQYVELFAYQNSGGALGIAVNSFVYFQWLRKHP